MNRYYLQSNNWHCKFEVYDDKVEYTSTPILIINNCPIGHYKKISMLTISLETARELWRNAISSVFDYKRVYVDIEEETT
jgi:hypothetical protein